MNQTQIKQSVSLFTQPNDGRGDCMFWSISQALNSYKGSAYGALWHHLGYFGLVPGKVTSTQLRTITYMLFLAPYPETDSIIDMWRTMLTASVELSIEYQQARALPPKPAAELTSAERFIFYRACMNPAVTWGEETALVFLERLLSIRCLVITEKVLQTRQFSNHSDDFQPLVFIPISLSNLHYQSITWFDDSNVEHAAFAEHEIPDILLLLSQRDCSKASQPFINLSRRIEFRSKELETGRPADVPFPEKPHTVDLPILDHFARCRALYVAETMRCVA